jgi:hypothetical protein
LTAVVTRAVGVDRASAVAVVSRVMASSSRRSRQQTRKPIDERTRTAYHEAGHAVLSAAINDTPHHVSIRADRGTLGRSAQGMAVRPTSLAQVYLAGFAAEHLLTGGVRRSRRSLAGRAGNLESLLSRLPATVGNRRRGFASKNDPLATPGDIVIDPARRFAMRFPPRVVTEAALIGASEDPSQRRGRPRAEGADGWVFVRVAHRANPV